MALNSFSKHSSNVLSAVLCFVCAIKTYEYWQDFRFYHKTKCKTADKHLYQGYHYLPERVENSDCFIIICKSIFDWLLRADKVSMKLYESQVAYDQPVVT